MLKDRFRLNQNGKLLQLPSQHASLAAAQTLYETCQLVHIDRFALELPRDIPPPPLLKTAAESNGIIGLFLAVHGSDIVNSVPDPDEPERSTRQRVKPAVAIPITPSDSIGLAMLMPSLRSDLWPDALPEFAFVDAARHVSQKSKKFRVRSNRLPDPYMADYLGLSAYLEGIRQVIQRPNGHVRDRAMAASLRPFARDLQNNTLAVYGAAHHDPIEHHLRIGRRSRLAVGQLHEEMTFRFIPLEPSHAYQMGVTDVPFLTWRFLQAVEQRSPFDLSIATSRLLGNALEMARGEGIPVPVQNLKTMLKYMKGLCKSRTLLYPGLRTEIIHSAVTCVGPEFADVLWRVAMQYPPNAEVSCARIVVDREHRVFLFFQGSIYRTDLLAQFTAPKRFESSPTEPSILTNRERAAVKSSPCMLPSAEEGELVADMNTLARQKAHQTQRKFIRLDFAGDFGEGICISSTAQHQLTAIGKNMPRWKTLVIKQAVQPTPPCSGTCPVVWCLSEDAPIVSRQTGSLVCEKYGWVNSSFYWRSEFSRSVDDCGAVRRSRTAYCTFLLREMPQPYNEENVTRTLTAYGEQRFCRKAPWNDAELGSFQGFDLAVAAGIKYAQGHVVVVARESVRIARQVAAFAESRSVNILRLKAEGFNPEFYERMAIDHELRAAGHYAKPHPFLSRFVTPMPRSPLW